MNGKIFFLKCISVGTITGAIVVLYRLSLDRVNNFRRIFFENLKNNITFIDILGIVIFLLFSSIFLGYIIKKYPMTRGGGVAFVKGDVEDNIDFSNSNKTIVKEIVFKLIGAILALSSGLSYGIEGPSIELGAEAGQGVGNFSKSIEKEKKYLITAGAAAGLAAAFNAPLTGIIFAFEQVIKTISSKHLTAILISSSIVGWMTDRIFGTKPFFSVELMQPIRIEDYYLIIIFALFVTIIGKIFFKISSELKKLNSLITMPYWLKPILPLFVGILMSFFFFDFTGEGYLIANKVILLDYSILALVSIFTLKFIYFIYSTSTDIPGGSFVPLISIGVILGKIYGYIVVNYFNFPEQYITSFIILGMSLLLTSIVRAPITGIVLIIEITGTNSFFYQLVLGTVCVSFFSMLFNMQPVYESALKQYLKKVDEEKKEGTSS